MVQLPRPLRLIRCLHQSHLFLLPFNPDTTLQRIYVQCFLLNLVRSPPFHPHRTFPALCSTSLHYFQSSLASPRSFTTIPSLSTTTSIYLPVQQNDQSHSSFSKYWVTSSRQLISLNANTRIHFSHPKIKALNRNLKPVSFFNNYDRGFFLFIKNDNTGRNNHPNSFT